MLIVITYTLHKYFKRIADPDYDDRINELLTVASGPVKVNHHDHVCVGGEEFRIPAVAPVVSPSPLRPAVNEEFDRVLLVGIKVRWLDQEAFNLVAIGAGEPEGLERRHGDLGENSIIRTR